jgi:DNA-binding SARP family transcriptional activator/predicted ATPase/tetratricopeptide (TPR) repeat protein
VRGADVNLEPPHIRAAAITVQLLRPFSVAIDGVAMPAHAWRLRHPRQLFQMLCLRSGHRMHRDEAIEALWPQSDSQASANRLYHTIHVLRAEFAKMGLDEREPVLLFQAGTLCLNPHHRFTIDALHFTAIVQACRDAGEALTAAQLEQAAALSDSAPIGENSHDEWLEPCRKEAGDHVIWILEQLARRYRATGRNAEAAEVLQRLVRVEPSNEIAHRGLMELFDATGQSERALLQYAACKRFLQRDLAAQPSTQTEALRDAVVARLAEARRVKPPTIAPDASPSRRPPAPAHAGLLGRTADLAELRAWLGDPQCRLITIAAPAGTGKTSLALALANDLDGRYADGVLVVRLTQLAEADELEQCICDAAGVSCGVRTPGQALRDHLAAKRLLLVLDRFEHLVSAAERLPQLLEHAPGMSLVVTSQCVLSCQAERVFALRQLAEASPAAAIELFIATAHDAGASRLVITEEIAGLCRRLGGNALAIKLAAAQLATRTIEQLREAIDRPLDFPGARATADEPQLRSLRGAIGWSMAILDTPTRAALCGLAVFNRSFTIDEAQEVLGEVFGAGVSPRAAIQALLERQLVCREAQLPGADRALRFVLLDSIHQFLLDQVAAFAEWPAVQAAHAGVFRRQTHDAHTELALGRNAAAMAIFEPAQSNIERALDRQLASGDTELYLLWCREFSALRLTRGQFREAADRLREATRLPAHNDAARGHRAWCGYLLSRTLNLLGDMPGAIFAIRMSRQSAIGIDDDKLHERIGTHLSGLRAEQLNLRAARLQIDGLLRLIANANMPNRLASLLCVSSSISALEGKYPEALSAAQASLDAALEGGNPQTVWLAYLVKCEAALAHGLLDVAAECATECRSIEESGGMPQSDLVLLGFALHFERREYAAARAAIEAAGAALLTSQPGYTLELVQALEFMLMVEEGRSAEIMDVPVADDAKFPLRGEFADSYVQLHSYHIALQAQRGDWAAAQASLTRVLQPVRRSRNPLWASWLVGALAGVAADRGDHDVGRRLLRRAEMLQRNAGIVPTPRQRSNWLRVRRIVEASPAMCALDTSPDDAARALPALIDRIERWARAVLKAPDVRRDALAGQALAA